MSTRPEWDDVDVTPGGYELEPFTERDALTLSARALAGRFLELIRSGYSPTKAAKALSTHRTAFYNLAERWPAFKDAWQRALDDSVDVLEDAAIQRAVHGVPRKQFYQGEEIPGSEYREYSDTLLLALLKARAPERYRERYDVNQHVDIRVDHAAEILAARKRAGLTIDATPTSVERTPSSDLKSTDDA